MDSTAQLILWGGGLYFFRELVLEGIKLINRYLKIKEDEIQLEKNNLKVWSIRYDSKRNV